MASLPFISRRSPVYGTHGMVCSSQPLASQAGLEVLKKGGNAADAAVAVAAALGVTEPGSTGIGGDAFCLFYDANSKTVQGLNGSGRTPSALTIELIRSQGVDGVSLPTDSVHAITVPGAAAAYVDTVKRFGSGKIDLATILQPAIDLAENGFPVSEISSHGWQAQQDQLIKVNPNYTDNGYLLGDERRAPKPGEIVVLRDLATTYKTLAREGKEGFYQGRIAEAIVSAIQSRGGLMTLEDLSSHTTENIDPISVDYHGWTVWEIPPNGQGITTLMALGILESLSKEHGIDFSKMNHNSAEYLHWVIEALRLAFADTRHFVGDPNVVHVPVDQLLSKAYLAERAKLIDPQHRNDTLKHGHPEEMGNTVYFSVVDEHGNACSFINSNFWHFGSHVIPDQCGFPLHNRGCNFVLIEGHANCIGSHKRPYHTIIPSMITRRQDDGTHELEACFGVMGAFMQPQGQVQVILNMMHYLQDPQRALDLPRICVAPPPQKSSGDAAYAFSDISKSVVFVEDGISDEAIQQLETRGHACFRVKDHGRSVFGRGQVIQVHTDARTQHRVLAGGSDPRGDGQASGW